MKVLVVDDSAIMRRAIEKYSVRSGLEVVATAGDGADVPGLIQQYQPEIVTLDVTMPKVDGITALEHIMKLAPETKVLVITALSDTSTGLKALKLGARGFLTKPFTEAQLTEELTHLMNEDAP